MQFLNISFKNDSNSTEKFRQKKGSIARDQIIQVAYVRRSKGLVKDWAKFYLCAPFNRF